MGHSPRPDRRVLGLGRANAPQYGRHRYDWSRLDGIAKALAENGVRWLPIIDYSTPWAASVPGNPKSPPASDADFAAYAEAFVRRYGRNGSFWARHPELPCLPVTAYEVWNQVNLHVFWQPTPDPVRYASLYAAAHEAIKHADPQATVLIGGLAPYADGFVREMYAARPDLRSKVDAVGYHPYGADAELVLRLVRKLRSTLDDLGEDEVPLWITEVGWPTQGTGGLVPRRCRMRPARRTCRLSPTSPLGGNCDVDAVTPYTWATPETDPEHDEMWLGIVHPEHRAHRGGRRLHRGRGAQRRCRRRNPARLAVELCRERGTQFASPLRLGVRCGARRAGLPPHGDRHLPWPAAERRRGHVRRRARGHRRGRARHDCERGDVSARALDVASGQG